jgi:HTH-type transcriptional regulator/antitoxin HigA
MSIKPIRNDEDLQRAFKRLEKIFQAEECPPQADERDVLVTLIEAYDARHFDFGPADPVEAIQFRMEQEGLTPRDLEPYIGQSGRVSEVLNRKRALSLRMVKRLHDGLRIPCQRLLAGVRQERSCSNSWMGATRRLVARCPSRSPSLSGRSEFQRCWPCSR